MSNHPVETESRHATGEDRSEGIATTIGVQLMRLGAALIVPIVTFFLLVISFQYLRGTEANRLIVSAVAILVGVLGVWGVFWGMDLVVNQLPARFRERVRPAVFVGPAVVFLGIFLVYPAINTVNLAFRDRAGQEFVGFENFVYLFTNESPLIAIRNSIVWVVIVPLVTVTIGLGFATMVDKLGRRAESVSKSMIFLPMAISLVGASIVWRFVYDFRPPGFGEQIGLVNAIWTGLGNDPVAWLQQQPWNNLFLMVIVVWLQTGFAMVILSSAIKAVPTDIIEAARIDGATEWKVFTRVVFPAISSTVVVVLTTVVLFVWKTFDIVWVMTGGRFRTQVVAQQMVTEFFTFRNNGRGAALAVLMFVAVVPVMYLNVRKFREQEQTR
jgi:alpha-glucoside transport system permease protein